ncbi:MAG: peptidylprolyl isomerase [Acidobacteria bacterium]|nr:peptidylprolyl isomerase [Acidobacteriota bacterium]
MKFLCGLVFAGALWAQTAPAPSPGRLPDLGDDEVVATFSDGSKVTMADVKAFYGILSAAQQQAVLRSPGEFVRQWGVMRRLAQIAVERKLDQESPYKQALEQARMNVLYQATINDTLNSITIEPADIEKYYAANQSKYTQVKVKAIYIAYGDSGSSSAAKGKKALTDAEAKAKAEKLLGELRGGADFVKLAKENSDDETSREKDGDFATLHFTDNIPDAFRSAIFKLKKGEITEPLKQPNGYYLFRADEVTVKPLAAVRDEIYNELKNERFNEWMTKLNRETVVQVNPKFTAPTPATTPAK